MTARPANRRKFDKYQARGAYHWQECDLRSKNFNPPLVARYQVVVDEVVDATHVLEIGAGDGRLTAWLAESAVRVAGVEVDDTAVRLASGALRNTENSSITQADCYKLPFASRRFDFAVMADVIEHLDEPDAALAEAARVLKQSGTLIVTTPKWRPDRVWDVRHVCEFTASDLERHLRKFFSTVELKFFWPLLWSNFYSTKVGWRVLRIYARYFPNPFLKSGYREASFGQILAVCREPVMRSCIATDRELSGADVS